MINSPNPSKKTPSARVVSIKLTDRTEMVYCCNEPETHTFVIGNGYLTGNCVSCSEESDFRAWNDANNMGGNCLEYTFLK